MIQEEHFLTQKSARYFRQNAFKERKRVWLIFHGYGQSAYHFLVKFRHFDADYADVIAPEGLSKFYLEGTSGRVGASWMTKENRLSEIQDQLQMMDTLCSNLGIQEGVELNLLGFSQGAAVACRWFQHTNIKIHNIILWGAGLPIETDDIMAQKYNESNCLFMLGKEDPLLSKENLERDFSRLEKLNFRHDVIWYDGGHKVDDLSLNLLKNHLKLT